MNIRATLQICLIMLCLGCEQAEDSRKTINIDLKNNINNDFSREDGRTDESYCQTTYFQVLANPEKYNEKKIRMLAWATSIGGVTILFPTKDQLDAADTASSLVVISGDKVAELVATTSEDQNFGREREVIVSGKFISNSNESSNRKLFHALDSDRFGALVELDGVIFR